MPCRHVRAMAQLPARTATEVSAVPRRHATELHMPGGNDRTALRPANREVSLVPSMTAENLARKGRLMALASITSRNADQFGRWMRHTFHRSLTATSCAALTFVVLFACVVANDRSRAEPQVQFPDPPKNARDAVSTLVQRRDKVVDYMACGSETNFLRKVENVDKSPGDPVGYVIGKMTWLILHADDPGQVDDGPPDVVKFHDDWDEDADDESRVHLMQPTFPPFTFPTTTPPPPPPGQKDCEGTMPYSVGDFHERAVESEDNGNLK